MLPLSLRYLRKAAYRIVTLRQTSFRVCAVAGFLSKASELAHGHFSLTEIERVANDQLSLSCQFCPSRRSICARRFFQDELTGLHQNESDSATLMYDSGRQPSLRISCRVRRCHATGRND